MTKVFIVPGGGLRSYYEQTMSYLHKKYHNYYSNLPDLHDCPEERSKQSYYEAQARRIAGAREGRVDARTASRRARGGCWEKRLLMILDGVINSEFVKLSKGVFSCKPLFVIALAIGAFFALWACLSWISGKKRRLQSRHFRCIQSDPYFYRMAVHRHS